MCLLDAIQAEPIAEFSSLEIAAIIISILALLLSVWQWIRNLRKERFSINVKCIGYQLLISEEKENYRNYTFGFIVDNLSSLPVSLSYISFLSDKNEWVRFCLTKRFMKEHFIPPGLNTPYQFFTSDFPVNIDSYTSVLVFATFESMNSTEVSFEGKNANFTFKTSRKEKVLTLQCSKMSVLNQ